MKFAVAFACTIAVCGLAAIWWGQYLGGEAKALYNYVNASIEDAKRERN